MDAEERLIFLRYIKAIQKWMKPEIDYTENFRDYALGNCPKKITYSNIRESLNILFDYIMPHERLVYPSLQKARDFWESTEYSLRSHLLNNGLHQYSGGWPAFQENWIEENFNWIQTLGLLAAMGIECLFSQTVEYTDRVRVTRISLQLPFIEYYRRNSDEDDEHCEELLYDLGLNETKIGEAINDVNSVIKGFPERIPEMYRAVNVHRRIRLSNEEIRNRQEFNYELYFSTYFGQPISDTDVFYFDFPDYAEEYLYYLSELEPRVLANFIMVQAADIHNRCPTNVTLKHFAPTLISASLSACFTPNDKRKHIEVFKRLSRLIDKIKEEVKDAYTTDAMDAYDIHTSLINYAEMHFSQDKIDEEYEDLEINRNDLYQNLVNIGRHGPTLSTRQFYLYHRPEDNTYDENFEEFLNFILEIIKTKQKPIIHYFHVFLYSYINNMIPFGCRSSQEYAPMVECIDSYIERKNLKWTPSRRQRYIDECTGIAIIVKVLWNDYKCWLEENEDIAREQDEILNEYNLDIKRVFFISLFQEHDVASLDAIATHLYLRNC